MLTLGRLIASNLKIQNQNLFFETKSDSGVIGAYPWQRWWHPQLRARGKLPFAPPTKEHLQPLKGFIGFFLRVRIPAPTRSFAESHTKQCDPQDTLWITFSQFAFGVDVAFCGTLVCPSGPSSASPPHCRAALCGHWKPWKSNHKNGGDGCERGGGGKSSSVPRFLFPGLDVGTASEVWGMRTGLEYKKACSSSIPCIPLRTKWWSKTTPEQICWISFEKTWF